MNKTTKAGRYSRLFNQAKELTEKTNNKTARMATICALLHHKMEYFFWTGFYLLDGEDLIVHTYQGPVACIKLAKNTGVCWAGLSQAQTIVVQDVHDFPGHIACDSRSQSEIVVPVWDKDGKVIGVLDVDSKELNSFDEIDKQGLEKIIGLLL